MIDTNVIIKQIRLVEMLKAKDDQDFNERFEVYTLPDVLHEIRDETARMYLDNLPYPLKIHSSLEESHYKFVRAFAKQTGDLKSLSETDMKVIALGV